MSVAGFHKVGIVGAGQMGAGIAQVMAVSGLQVFVVDKEKFYEVEISYSDVGYVSSDRFKNFTPKDIMNTMKQNKPESVSDVNWVLEPSLSEKKISTYGYRVDWKDGGIGYEYEGIVLGREGYFDISYATSGDGNETKDYFYVIELFKEH